MAKRLLDDGRFFDDNKDVVLTYIPFRGSEFYRTRLGKFVLVGAGPNPSVREITVKEAIDTLRGWNFNDIADEIAEV